MKILIVDDDESIRALLKIAFSIEDGVTEVREADGGRLAIEECSGFEPDVIFMDYWMPEMDGGTAAQLIRALHPDVCIVAFSGVLETRPPWADMLCVKGEMPDVGSMLNSVRERRPV